MSTLIERLHESLSRADQATLVDGEVSHVVVTVSPLHVDADVWALLQDDYRHDEPLSERLTDLWEEQILADGVETVPTQADALMGTPGYGLDDAEGEHPVPVVLLAGTRPTPTALADGLWREPQLRALEEQTRDLVAERLSGKPLDPLHQVKAGARWAQSAVEGPIALIAVALGRKVGRAAQDAPGRARSAWKDFLHDVDRDR